MICPNCGNFFNMGKILGAAKSDKKKQAAHDNAMKRWHPTTENKRINPKPNPPTP